MPIFDYTCDSCKTTDERFVSHQSVDSQTCRKCGSVLRKRIGPTKTNFHYADKPGLAKVKTGRRKF